MANYLLILIAIALYLAASVVTAMYIRGSGKDNMAGGLDKLIAASYWLACAALVFHLFAVSQISFIGHSLNFSVASMVVLVSGIVVLFFLVGGLAMPIRRLGILVYPLTIISLIFAISWGGGPSTPESHGSEHQGIAFTMHILISISAYALLAIASIQALLYLYQEKLIKKRSSPAMLMALPPLQTMEALLFRLVTIGFTLLTLALVSGAAFSQQIFGHAFAFNHHTILAVLGWLVFATMLVKRARHGLRGSHAVSWTIGGFLLIQLGYFGTKIVSESLSVQ